jgi:hypothetical protein
MNYRYYFIGIVLLVIALIMPFQIYKIRQRRLAERVHAEQHFEGEDYSCCSCH